MKILKPLVLFEGFYGIIMVFKFIFNLILFFTIQGQLFR